MPFSGKQNVQAAAVQAPLLNNLDTEAWELKGAEILQVSFEVVESLAEELIPPALHPTIPPYATLSVIRYSASPVGPFSLGLVKVVGRAGVRPRAYLVGAYTDSEKAAPELRTRWGFPVRLGAITLELRHDRIVGRVQHAGQTILEIALENPELISGSDITYNDSLHLARMRENGQEKPVLIQVDPEYVFHSAQRGRPRLITLRGEAWGMGDQMQCTDPITATFTKCDTDLPTIRFALDPLVEGARGRIRQLAARGR
jgi:hypothetical protein